MCIDVSTTLPLRAGPSGTFQTAAIFKTLRPRISHRIFFHIASTRRGWTYLFLITTLALIFLYRNTRVKLSSTTKIYKGGVLNLNRVSTLPLRRCIASVMISYVILTLGNKSCIFSNWDIHFLYSPWITISFTEKNIHRLFYIFLQSIRMTTFVVEYLNYAVNTLK